MIVNERKNPARTIAWLEARNDFCRCELSSNLVEHLYNLKISVLESPNMKM